MIFEYCDPHSLAAIESHGSRVYSKFIIHSDTSLFAYSLDILARVILGQEDATVLGKSCEKIAGDESNVLLFRHARIGQRELREWD